VHQLTIHHVTAPVTITVYVGFDEAHRALLTYAIGADYYLWASACADCHTHYQLLRLAEPDDPQRPRRPHIIGTATIEELPDGESCARPPTADAPITSGAAAP
jgi:hypothetical protein